eukprot:75711_1
MALSLYNVGKGKKGKKKEKVNLKEVSDSDEEFETHKNILHNDMIESDDDNDSIQELIEYKQIKNEENEEKEGKRNEDDTLSNHSSEDEGNIDFDEEKYEIINTEIKEYLKDKIKLNYDYNSNDNHDEINAFQILKSLVGYNHNTNDMECDNNDILQDESMDVISSSVTLMGHCNTTQTNDENKVDIDDENDNDNLLRNSQITLMGYTDINQLNENDTKNENELIQNGSITLLGVCDDNDKINIIQK